MSKTKHGETAFLFSMAFNQASFGNKVGFVNLEMGNDLLVKRFQAMQAPNLIAIVSLPISILELHHRKTE